MMVSRGRRGLSCSAPQGSRSGEQRTRRVQDAEAPRVTRQLELEVLPSAEHRMLAKLAAMSKDCVELNATLLLLRHRRQSRNPRA